MIHRPISIHKLSFSFSEKICFQDFSAQIFFAQKILILGPNGSGKTTLLQILQGLLQPSNGKINFPEEVNFGYVPQIIDHYGDKSGGERFQKALSNMLSLMPNILLLDEPTNHLDKENRLSLMAFMEHFHGTLIVVSHDAEVMRKKFDQIWVFDNHKIDVFQGDYHDYLHQKAIEKHQLKESHTRLKKDQKKFRLALQIEQKRAAQAKRMNFHENDRKLKGKMRESGSKTSSKKTHKINQIKDKIDENLKNFYLNEELKPKFRLRNEYLKKDKIIVSIKEGACGYNELILKDIYFQLQSQERVAVLGANGSGKSTFVKAVVGDAFVSKQGEWLLPSPKDIAYLDQSYDLLKIYETPYDAIQKAVGDWGNAEIRNHLNFFLFRKNSEVYEQIQHLSGGEKVRLCLAYIAAFNPKLLILDEVTNNIDLTTKEHLIKVLKTYEGSLIIISHDQSFLEEIHIHQFYEIKNKMLKEERGFA